MVPVEIIHLRLQNQQLIGSNFKKPDDVVKWMGAIQAQDYAGCKWAVGLRTINSTDKSIEEAINKNKIIRTHILRPTWHLVHPQDIRWMLMLTAPRVHAFCAFGYRKMELNDAIFKKAHKVFVKALDGGKQLTRTELATELQKAKIATDDLRMIHLLVHAELEALICNGAKRDKQFTYALMDDCIPTTKTITKEEALVKLAEGYFKSHGPATLQDFNWWSGLTTKDSKLGLENIKASLTSETIDGKTYWMTHEIAASKIKSSVLILPSFDEYTVSYKDRSLVVDAAALKKTGNGIFKPLLVVDGQAKGIWKRNDKKSEARVTPTLFEKLNAAQTKMLSAEIERYTKFLNRTT
ncbi:MAG TPA: winged helix DNA-binding domain-containing protein [Bacteroidia bacterium]|nr:winged helix DNA-binding domain-containing protein [Bacteroidia bacterium]HRG52331.1 winged helix DNA-binding domain-containing protein [Bacteroidia bacterium]